MAYYIKLFQNHSDYLAFTQTGDFIRPNVSACVEQEEVHYNPFDPFNGYEYVDMGLPSGTLWARMNIGSQTTDDYGSTFKWGDLTTQDNCRLYDSDNDVYLKYNQEDNLLKLEIEDDAARAQWGGKWHIPTKEQWQELIDNTDFSRGQSGTGFTLRSKINGAQLYFPYPANGQGRVWTSSVYGGGNSAYYYFYQQPGYAQGGGHLTNGDSRCSSFSIRPVIGILYAIEKINGYPNGAALESGLNGPIIFTLNGAIPETITSSYVTITVNGETHEFDTETEDNKTFVITESEDFEGFPLTTYVLTIVTNAKQYTLNAYLSQYTPK